MRVQFLRTLVLIGVITASLASAHPAEALREDAARRSEGDSGGALDRILTFQMERMTGALKLSDDQVTAISPRVRRLAEMQVESRRKRADLLQRLQDDTNAGNDDRVQEDLGLLREHDDRTARRTEELQRDINDQLTPKQQAGYVLFRERFTRELQRAVGEARRRGDRPNTLDDKRRPPRRPDR